MKIKTLDINVKEWFDKINGNSYFAGEIVIDYGMKTEKTILLPFQYGYGEHYRDVAIDTLDKLKIIDNNSYLPLWRYCNYNDIILRTNKDTNCKKRELLTF